MGDGWRKGLGAYSGSSAGLRRGEDYRNREIRTARTPDGNHGGYSSALPKGPPPRVGREKGYSLKPVSAEAPKGKYGRK